MIIDILNENEVATAEAVDLVTRVLSFVATKEEISEDAEVSVSFVSNEEIQEINRTYRGKDAVTDVISFALQEKGEGEIEIIGEEPILLGDIIISVDRAKEQAEDYNHSFEREVAFLAVHGLLHLLGYDHMTEEDEQQMFAKQHAYLADFGLPREE